MKLVSESGTKMKNKGLQRLLRFMRVHWRALVILSAPIVFLPLALFEEKRAKCGFTLCLMATYWVTEALPLPVTSLIPMVLFPVFGILSSNEVCMLYFKDTNIMFLGGVIIAIAVEHCNLHKRIALRVIISVGTSPQRLLLGVMGTTMFLSMWISNSAATSMMVPIVAAVLEEIDSSTEESRKQIEEFRNLQSLRENPDAEKAPAMIPPPPPRKDSPPGKTSRKDSPPGKTSRKDSPTDTESSAPSGSDESVKVEEPQEIAPKSDVKLPSKEEICYYLGVAYSANIGGTGTITGTAPNLVFKSLTESLYKSATGINFATWMIYNIPLMVLNTILAWLWLQMLYLGLFSKKSLKLTPKQLERIKKLIIDDYKSMGRMTYHEASVLLLFLLAVSLWFFRKPEFMSGWSEYFPDVTVKDGTTAIAVVILLFILPSNLHFLKRGIPPVRTPPLLKWKVLEEKLPVGIILLLGSGFALAKGVEVSGLSRFVGEALHEAHRLPILLTLTIVCYATSFATEVSSNTAMANIALPVLAKMCHVIRVHPFYLMFPTTICCSYAFMLPVATPPNAIVATACNMRSVDMMKTGVGLNFICVTSLLLSFIFFAVPLYGFDTFPDWAIQNDTLGEIQKL